MLNPSTATEVQNDPTVERCERRARHLGFADGVRACMEMGLADGGWPFVEQVTHEDLQRLREKATELSRRRGVPGGRCMANHNRRKYHTHANAELARLLVTQWQPQFKLEAARRRRTGGGGDGDGGDGAQPPPHLQPVSILVPESQSAAAAGAAAAAAAAVRNDPTVDDPIETSSVDEVPSSRPQSDADDDDDLWLPAYAMNKKKEQSKLIHLCEAARVRAAMTVAAR